MSEVPGNNDNSLASGEKWRPPPLGNSATDGGQNEGERPLNNRPVLRLVVIALVIAAVVAGANWRKISARFTHTQQDETLSSPARSPQSTPALDNALTNRVPPTEATASPATAPQRSEAADLSAIDTNRFSIPENTMSPDRHYGVGVPREAEPEGSRGGNQVVDLTTNKILARIDAFTYWEGKQLHMNHAVLNPQWSEDGTELAWVVEGKWSPRAFTLLKIADANVKWQLDVIPAVQREILSQTRAATPDNYEAAKNWNAGNGSAFPDGFVVGIETPKNRFRLPLRCRVTLDSNPKRISTAPTDLRASMNAIIQEDGIIAFNGFEIEPGTIKSTGAQEPTREQISESQLLGIWQGKRHTITFFPDHTFKQNGLHLPDGMKWRLNGTTLTRFYPDLDEKIPAWYPYPGNSSLTIVSLKDDELITGDEQGPKSVQYRIKSDDMATIDSAATRAYKREQELNGMVIPPIAPPRPSEAESATIDMPTPPQPKRNSFHMIEGKYVYQYSGARAQRHSQGVDQENSQLVLWRSTNSNYFLIKGTQFSLFVQNERQPTRAGSSRGMARNSNTIRWDGAISSNGDSTYTFKPQHVALVERRNVIDSDTSIGEARKNLSNQKWTLRYEDGRFVQGADGETWTLVAATESNVKRADAQLVGRGQSPLLQPQRSNAPSPAEAKEIGKSGNYRATAAWIDGGGATVWLLKRPSDELVATLRGGEEYDHIGNVGPHAVFSSDGELIAYSVGTASGGTELRLFRIRSGGQAEKIPLQDKSQELLNRAWDLVKKKKGLPEGAFSAHLYCVPVSVSSAPLAITFDLEGNYGSPDHDQPRFEPTRFRYEIESKKLETVPR